MFRLQDQVERTRVFASHFLAFLTFPTLFDRNLGCDVAERSIYEFKLFPPGLERRCRVAPNQIIELSTWKVWRLKQLGATGCNGSRNIDCCSRSERLWSVLVQTSILSWGSSPVWNQHLFWSTYRVAPNLFGSARFWSACLNRVSIRHVNGIF